MKSRVESVSYVKKQEPSRVRARRLCAEHDRSLCSEASPGVYRSVLHWGLEITRAKGMKKKVEA
jgi:hypothetical protein